MAFFRNKSFNLIYGHTAFQAIAFHGGEAFAFVYLLKAGLSAPVVTACIGLMFGSRMIFRLLVVPIALKIGLRLTFVLGILLEGLTYPLLSQVNGVGLTLLAYLTLWSLSSSIYWTTMHAYIAQVGDNAHRGTQVSGIEFIGATVGIVAPIMSGLLLTYTTPFIAFSIVGLAMACSAIPILFGPEVAIAPTATIAPKAKTLAWRAMFADGLRAGTMFYIYLLALFITLGENFANYGGALALAGVVGALMGLVSGRIVDLGKGKLALQLGVGVMIAAALIRAFGYHVPWSAVLGNAAAVVAWPLFAPPFNGKLYERAQQSSCALRFHVIAEGGWDLGCALGCGLACIMLSLGFSFFWPLLSSVLACVLIYLVLEPEYRNDQ